MALCGLYSNTGSLTDTGPRRIVCGLLLAAWVVIWFIFVIKELVAKHEFRRYADLFSCTLEGKHAYVTGVRLYELLAFASANIPAGATVTMCGLEKGSIDNPRAMYYLYPRRMLVSGGDYLCVYDAQCSDPQYEEWKRLDDKRFIMRRKAGGA